ncbi:MAG TPA: hypothetical protein GXZ78_08600 [Eubacteriaceae bacterium]|nr:hypothetical protein [Eubacteriaceae bacterium]
MKKIIMLLVIVLLFVGCSNGENTAGPVNNGEEQQSKGFEFVYNGITIRMYDEASQILEGLGEEVDYFEAESCAFQGMDKIYTYGPFELHTHEIDGIDHVSSIIFLDDSISTKEGIYLFSSLDEVLQAYGDNYTEEHGLYTYEMGNSKLLILIEDDEVVSIEYMAKTEQ